LCAQQMDGTLELVPPSTTTHTNRDPISWRTEFVLSITIPVVQLVKPEESLAAATPQHVGASISISQAEKKISHMKLLCSPPQQAELVKQLLSPSFKVQRSTMKILIVEDNMVNIKVIKQCLVKRDFKALTIAANGQFAVDESLKAKFDVILMDLEMPVKDGVTASLEITSDPSNPNHDTPIIAITANATNMAQFRCVDAGMCLYLTKPLIASDLMFTLAALKPFQFYPFELCPHVLLYQQGHREEVTD